MLLLEFREVTKVFRQKLLKKGKLEAVKGVSLEIRSQLMDPSPAPWGKIYRMH
jgi:ABC-type antimicrobial peptide transport system ATPase subunit